VMLNNLGILHLEINDAPQALSYLTRCLQLARETGNESIQAAALDNTSNAYYQIGQYENALASAIESVRLCQELGSKSGEAEAGIRQRTAQLEALREVGLEITAQLGLDSLLRSIVARASEMLGDVSGGLYLYQPERDVLEWAVSIGSHAAPAGIVLQRGEGLAGKVWETGKPLIVDDYQSWAGRAAAWEDYPVVAVMGVPVCWGQGFLGVLNVAADASRSFSQADAELLGLFAIQAAIAIRYAWLYEEAQEEIAERKRAEEQREKLIAELREALARVKTLSGLLPICAACKKIRDDQGYWHQVEVYVRDHSEADFTHGICPDCRQRLYPGLYPEKE
jgi:transcriptional regulator with GAF, ATPase, and Fis domain